MDVYNIKDFKGGWFIGDFNPSVFKNCFFEVAHHTHLAGYKGPLHTHKISTEVTYIVRGAVKIADKIYAKGDMFVYYPNEISDVIVLQDVDLIVVKWPSIPSDKYDGVK